jgi:hypothetical protein
MLLLGQVRCHLVIDLVSILYTTKDSEIPWPPCFPAKCTQPDTDKHTLSRGMALRLALRTTPRLIVQRASNAAAAPAAATSMAGRRGFSDRTRFDDQVKIGWGYAANRSGRSVDSAHTLLACGLIEQEEARESQFIRKKDQDNMRGMIEKMQAAEQNQVSQSVSQSVGQSRPVGHGQSVSQGDVKGQSVSGKDDCLRGVSPDLPRHHPDLRTQFRRRRRRRSARSSAPTFRTTW